jgi:hypothetical protein
MSVTLRAARATPAIAQLSFALWRTGQGDAESWPHVSITATFQLTAMLETCARATDSFLPSCKGEGTFQFRSEVGITGSYMNWFA